MAITAANASSCDGIVLASSCRVCAGLDLKELHGASLVSQAAVIRDSSLGSRTGDWKVWRL